MNGSFRPPGGGALERLLMEAAQDPLLAERLERDPLVTAEEHGVPLSPTERALLESTEPMRLRSMIQALSTRGVQPPAGFDDDLDLDVVSLGIRGDRPSRRDAVCTGIRADQAPPAPPAPPGPPQAPVVEERMGLTGIRPGRRRLKVAAAAAATVTALGVGSAIFFSAGSRPRRPATTAPKSTPDADAPDAGGDAGGAAGDTPAGAGSRPTPSKRGAE